MHKRNILSYETCVHAIAGSMGSISAMAVFYPLDIVRFRKQLEETKEDDNRSSLLQSLYTISNSEGLSALYRGIKPVLISLGTSNFIYFYTFHGLKHALSNSAKHDLALGIISGVVNVLLTTPLWVVNSRLKVTNPVHYSGLLDGLVYIARTEGIKALWSGLKPSLMLVTNPALQFTVYEALKRRVPVKTSIAIFIMGAVAKMAATIATYPLQLAQTRQRYQGENNMSMAALLLSILKRGGPQALYKGLEAKLWQTMLTAALMFVAYEKIFYFVLNILIRKSHHKL